MTPHRFFASMAFVALGLPSACIDEPRRPLDLAASEQRLRARSLADPKLREACVAKLGVPSEPWPPRELDLAELTLAAWLFRPELEAARVRVEGAERRADAAGRLRNPTLELTPGRVGNTDASPWIVTALLSFDVPLSGRPSKERAVASQEVELARLDAVATAWRVYGEVRDAAIEAIAAADLGYVAANELRLKSDRLTLARTSRSVGATSSVEVRAAEGEVDRATDELAQSSARLVVARARLAAAIGVTALDAATTVGEPALVDAPSETPLTDRLDLRRSLAAYEATERALELELSKQYPDFKIGPGFEYDQGARKYLLGFGVELPLFDRNQAGIADALARRSEAAADFETRQAAAIAELDVAQHALTAARTREREADGPALKRTQERVATTIQAFQRGAADKAASLDAQLEFFRHQRVSMDAKRALFEARARLEDALQRPLDPKVASLGGDR